MILVKMKGYGGATHCSDETDDQQAQYPSEYGSAFAVDRGPIGLCTVWTSCLRIYQKEKLARRLVKSIGEIIPNARRNTVVESGRPRATGNLISK